MNDAPVLLRNLLLWGIPFAIVVGALGYETDWGRDVARAASAPPVTSPQPVAVSLLPEYRIDGGVEARKETVDRVLFNPTRRPAPPAAQTANSKSAMSRGLYTLTGTTVVGNVATAVLREVNGGKSRTVRQGETLNGMLIAEVKPDHVRLKQGDDVEDLQLKIAGGPKMTVQTAVNPPAAPPAAATAAAQPANVAPPAGGTRAVPPAPVAAAPATPGAAPGAMPGATPGATPDQQGVVSVRELLNRRRQAAQAAGSASGGSAQ